MAASDTALRDRATGHQRPGGISSSLLGMVLFIASEVMFFGGLFGAYFTIRAAATTWPPQGRPALAGPLADGHPGAGRDLPRHAGLRLLQLERARWLPAVQRGVRLALLHHDRVPRGARVRRRGVHLDRAAARPLRPVHRPLPRHRRDGLLLLALRRRRLDRIVQYAVPAQVTVKGAAQ